MMNVFRLRVSVPSNLRVLVPSALMIFVLLSGTSGGVVQEEEISSLSGIILDGTTDQPLASVRVSLDDLSVSTDAEGRFAFERVEPGTHHLDTLRDGYMPAAPEGRRWQEGHPILIDVRVGEVLEHTLRMYPASVVSGRIFDTFGRAVRGAVVIPYRYTYNEDGVFGPEAMAVSRLTSTFVMIGRLNMGIPFPETDSHVVSLPSDDRGEFRVYNLPPGRYTFYVAPPVSGGTVNGVFYSGARDPQSASAVDLVGGEEIRLADIVMAEGGGGTLQVRVTDPWGLDYITPLVELRYPGSPEALAGQRSTGPGGLFGPLDPGGYELTVAVADREGEFRLAATRLQVQIGTQDDVVDVAVPLGAPLRGQVLHVNSSGETSPAAGAELFLRSREFLRDYRLSATSDANGMFRYAELPAGRYDIDSISSVSQDLCLGGVFQGNNEVRGTGIAVGRNVPELTVELTELVNRVEGSVTDSSGEVVAGAVVALIPDDRGARHRFIQADTDQNGRFEFTCVIEGAYQLYAWWEIEPNAYRNAAFMREYDGAGRAIAVDIDDGIAIDLVTVDR